MQHALGDVPLVGFFAAGEIARHHLYGYTGVLTVVLAGLSAPALRARTSVRSSRRHAQPPRTARQR